VRSVRAPAFAGRFYPADAAELGEAVDTSVAAAGSTDVEPVAVVAPHAGYRWSAPVAAVAHTALANRSTPIDRVVVAGPTHQVSVKGIGVTSATTFSTPLGELPVDTEAVASISDLPGVVNADHSHRREYSLEVQLPFIQRLIGEVPIVPLLIGARSRAWMAADVYERLCRDDRTALVVSSDLSHHHHIDEARRIDETTSDLMGRLDIESIGPERMCGAGAVRGLMKAALRRHLDVHTLEVRNSGDFGADPGRVVGYGAYAFSETDHQPPTGVEAAALHELADSAARHRIETGELHERDLSGLHPRLMSRGAAFVSVSVGDTVRGCIGRVEPDAPLAETVAWAAGAAVEGRAWFEPVSISDLGDLAVEVQVLSPLTRLHPSSADDLAGMLQPGRDGLVIAEREQRATYLPTVWDSISEPDEFVTGLLAKGRFEGPWTKQRAAYRYSTTVVDGR
jgi:AmmeMemoRadiSam system protein B/AmmeMemoRadiSam system protein A